MHRQRLAIPHFIHIDAADLQTFLATIALILINLRAKSHEQTSNPAKANKKEGISLFQSHLLYHLYRGMTRINLYT
jgi:hypothetical protein